MCRKTLQLTCKLDAKQFFGGRWKLFKVEFIKGKVYLKSYKNYTSKGENWWSNVDNCQNNHFKSEAKKSKDQSKSRKLRNATSKQYKPGKQKQQDDSETTTEFVNLVCENSLSRVFAHVHRCHHCW